MKKRHFLLFFYLPFIGFMVLFFVFSTVNRSLIRRRVENLVENQLRAAANILKTDISRDLENEMDPKEILNFYYQEETIHFMALLDQNLNPLDWRTRYEGYLPLASQQSRARDSWIIESPVGKIFNLLSPVPADQGQTYYLYLGYSLQSLESMLSRSRRMFWILFTVMGGIGVLFYIGLFRIQNRYLHKVRELDEQVRQKERFREISAFTSGVAHEIKNPLNRLALLLELMQKKGTQPVSSLTKKGKAEVQAISGIIDRFSAALKPLRVRKETIVLKDMIKDLLLPLEKQHPELNLEFNPKSSISFKGDPELIRQALHNLITNAAEAGSPGSVSISSEKLKSGIRISVSDSGPGIPPEDYKRIFDPFFSRKSQGMGVGLYITRKIVEAHAGRIRVISSPGSGSTFIITLPGE